MLRVDTGLFQDMGQGGTLDGTVGGDGQVQYLSGHMFSRSNMASLPTRHYPSCRGTAITALQLAIKTFAVP
uniref:Uncharacterized protein n=1 Tax=Candidatus Kentrum sp. TC TaxID=2126339 RepID=A0A451A796_9GAMM|nr:MAG: hypothetical protein BECKTC1821F_GA0114240_10654 [Candidatus Kentron sp. TC]